MNSKFILALTITLLVLGSARAGEAAKGAATPPKQDVADVKAVGPACYYNPQNITWYVSVRWPGGNSNFTLPPGGTHRLNNMNDADTYECWSTAPMGSGCPNRRKTVVNNCG